MAKNIQLYDYSGTTKLYPTTVSGEVYHNGNKLTNVLSGIQVELANIEGDIADVNNTLQSAIDDNTSEISSIKSGNSTRDMMINDHEDRITSLEGKRVEDMEAINGNISSIQTTLQAGIEENSGEISSIKSGNSTRDLMISDHEDRITGLEIKGNESIQATKIVYNGKTLDTVLGDLSSDITAAHNRLDSLTTIIDDLDKRIGKLENPE